MEQIVGPIRRGDRSSAVQNLQDALLTLAASDSSDGGLDALRREREESVFGDATAEALARFQREQHDRLALPDESGAQVDEPTAAALNALLALLGLIARAPVDAGVIAGRVELEDGTPLAGVRVRAFDRDLGRRRQQLGDGEQHIVTREDGTFGPIRYRASQTAEGEGRAGPGADVVLEVTDAEGDGGDGRRTCEIVGVYRRRGSNGEHAEEPVPDLVLGFAAAPEEEVRVVIGGHADGARRSEYRTLMRDLERMLLDGATPADLDQEHYRDFDLAARDTGRDRAIIETLTVAWRLAREADREPSRLAETFYGLLRHGPPTKVAPLPSELSELLARPSAWGPKLDDSIRHRIIDGDVDHHVALLRGLRVGVATRTTEGRRVGVGDLLDAAGIAEDDRRALLDAYHRSDRPIEEFWREVVPSLGWSDERARAARDALRLGELVGHDRGILEALRARGMRAPRELTALGRRDWEELVDRVGPADDAPGENREDKVRRTVDAITATVDASFPTEAVAHVARETRDENLAAARDLLGRFFDRESTATREGGFDILATPVTQYLEQHGDRVFEGLRDEERMLLRSQLQRLQRAFRLGADRDQTSVLLESKLDSAFHVTRFSPEHFAQEFGERLGGRDAAESVYSRAEMVAGTVLDIYTDLWHSVHATQPAVIRSATQPEGAPSLKDLPEYRSLFGGVKLCDCGHCQSFYSPAAYFVDLLHMLDRPALGAANPVEQLFRRRPDLAHIQLTCENTNTLIPYVDLVSEVLESFVANRAPKAFNVPPAPPNTRLPSPTAEELRVNPVYLTKDSTDFADVAYGALQEAAFPLGLPLNLPLETTRAYLDHLGLSRAELMALFDRDPGFEALMGRAAEILRLSPEEFELVTGARFSGASATRPATMAELFGLVEGTGTGTVFNASAPDFAPGASPADPRDALIRSLQNVLGVLVPNAPAVTGKYDTATVAAVDGLRTKHGLPANGRTDDAFWGALESDGVFAISAIVCPVPMFLDRSGLTMKELVTLLGTRFVNPSMRADGDADYLVRVGVPAADVRAWIQSGLGVMPPAIQGQLATVSEDETMFTEWVRRHARAVVINTAFDAICDLDRATLMHLDGTLLSPGELSQLLRFVRVWRKLGWTIDELDQVLDPGGLDGAAAFGTLLLLANVKQLRDQFGMAVTDVAVLWQPISTRGARSPYDRLFRNRAAQLVDPILALNADRSEVAAFELATPAKISDHVGPLIAAFRLSAQDFELVRAATGLADDPTLSPSAQPALSLQALSAIYRRVALARALAIPVRELLTLIDLTGLAVFDRPDRFERGDALAFAELVEKVKDSGMRVAQLEYLARGTAQTGPAAGAQRSAWGRTVAAIVDGLRAIRAEEPIEDDPDGEALTARLTGVLGPDDARAVTALVYGRATYRASLTGLPATFVFPAAMNGRATYDATRKELRVRGALTPADFTALLGAPGVPLAVQPAYSSAVKAIDAEPRAFVRRVLGQLYAPGDAEASLIDISSFAATGAPDVGAIATKAADLLVRRRSVLSRGLIKQTLTTASGLAADVVGQLLENESVLVAIDGIGPAVEDYQDIDGDGVDAEYFSNPDLIDPVGLLRVDEGPALDTGGLSPASGIPGIGFSVRWTGQLYIPAAGTLTFRVRCTDGVRLRVNDTLVVDEWQDQPQTEFNATIKLDGGQFYPIVVEYYSKTTDALLELSWSSPAIPAATIPQTALYTTARFTSLLERVERIHRIAAFLAPFEIGARELRLLAEHGNIALDLLPLSGPTSTATAQATFAQWMELRDYASLRDRYPEGDISLAEVLVAPTPEERITRFVSLSGAATDTVDALVRVLTVRVFDSLASLWSTEAPDLGTLAGWTRLADALAMVQRTGATPERLLDWARTREVDELATGPVTRWVAWTAKEEGGTDRRATNAELAQESKNVVRARYDEERWRKEARSLNDVLRERRRSALTAYVLAMPEMMRARVSDSGRLFEYLLIDVEMDPCMETSRIKQGISSVQLFVQRVLLALDPEVPTSRVDRARWEWMKVYRVWEANRKVLLYAESYTVEALRDDKTPFFTEMESELQQNELTEENVERAFRHYLEKLDAVAKLIVCGSCIDAATGTLHVFGRSATTPFVFYHRRLEGASTLSWTDGVWTPWERLPVDVAAIDDGDDTGIHLMPVMWNRRLYLFWPVFEQTPDIVESQRLPDGFDEIPCWQIRLAWSEFKDGRWSPKQTGVPVIDSYALVKSNSRDVTPAREFFYPDKVTITYEVKAEILGWTAASFKLTTTLLQRNVITWNEDPMLSGTVVEKAGDWASHEHREIGITVYSLLPKPSDHTFDVKIAGDELTITAYARYEGKPRGQFRSIKMDKLVVVRDGQRSDRNERDQIDGRTESLTEHVYDRLGKFHFPACATHVDASVKREGVTYASLPQPQDTRNRYLAFYGDSAEVTQLRLASGAKPILRALPSSFEVIDADGRVEFGKDGPFFFQDQRRCYLVTRNRRVQMFDQHDTLKIHPDLKVSVDEGIGLLSALDSRKTGFAMEASVREHPWATAAVTKWADGPALPISLRPLPEPPAAMHTMSGSLGAMTSAKKYRTEVVATYLEDLDPPKHPEHTFTPFFHPYTCPFLAALNSGGLPALFALDVQNLSDAELLLIGGIGGSINSLLTNQFEKVYKPDAAQVVQPYPYETVDFSRSGAYSRYNWEIFHHAPMTIASAFARAGRHEDAMRWFHFVFDPMTADTDTSERRVWRFLPFRTADTTRIEELVTLLGYTGSDATKLARKAEFRASIAEWMAHPFNPHLIARRRPVVYMKHAFMAYLDNLITWADGLFQRDTIESINEATMLYVLVANLLGPRPQAMPNPGSVQPETYQTLRGKLDELSNAQVDLETRLPFTQLFAPPSGAVGTLSQLPKTLYFCLPQNDKLLAYWDTIADRLFKIRHCMSFDGTVRQLPLFEPPIDPMLLVEAVAKGLDIGSVLNDLYAPLPRYRFTYMLQQALAMCAEVRALGGLLLTVLEKRDAEALAALRAGHETQLLDQVKTNKKLQIDEAEQTSRALDETARVVTGRIEHFDFLLTQGLNPEESDQLKSLDTANEWQELASWIENQAQGLYMVPSFTSGTEITVSFGGPQLGGAASSLAKGHANIAGSHNFRAGRSSITAGHSRRAEEWRFQRDLAKRELMQVERQSAAARIRRDIAKGELRNHETQLEHARGVEELLRTKSTSEGMWSWMEGQLRAVYFQSYQAAYELAKRAERCWRYERGADANFVKFDAWDSGARGLLAGERLGLQLKQMERAFLDQQVRELEVSKDIELAQLDPLALIQLKEKGVCEVDIPEWLFDVDYPGHYFRRLKSVSLSIPAVVGRGTNLAATLTLLNSKVRESSRIVGSYGADENYRSDHLPIEAIAVGTAPADAGRFVLDFRDEKYLPFEGAGAISRWRIELPRRLRSYDYDAIANCMLHLRFTARRDETLTKPALDALQALLDSAGEGTMFHLFSLRHDFPNEWQTLRASPTRAATLTVTRANFPYLAQNGAITVSELQTAMILKEDRPALAYRASLTPGPSAAPVDLKWPGAKGRYRSTVDTLTIPIAAKPSDGAWELKLVSPALPADVDRIRDLLIAVRYAVKV